jgi:uncharacterized protein YndB with AHSA1/START domain
MLNATHETTINQTAAEVYAFLADPMNGPRWRSGILQLSKVSGVGVGVRYRQEVAGPGGRRVDADIETTALEPNRRSAFRTIAGPVRPEGVFEITEADGGATRIRFSLSAELRGLKMLMAPLVRRTMESEVAAIDRIEAAMSADRG